jgi:hypothetical protein
MDSPTKAIFQKNIFTAEGAESEESNHEKIHPFKKPGLFLRLQILILLCVPSLLLCKIFKFYQEKRLYLTELAGYTEKELLNII